MKHTKINLPQQKILLISFLMVTGYMFVEFIGGFYTGSLALISDAGHMLSDSISLFLSFMAIWFAEKPATETKTYGYKRMEILTALFNGITLALISFYIFYEAYKRFFAPVEIESKGMLIIALIGLFVNFLVVFLISKKTDRNDVNMRSALYHVLSDLLGSVSAILAAILILLFQWYIMDSIASVIVALFVLYSSWNIIRDSVNILMESVPSNLHLQEIRQSILSIQGIINVHDLHIWTVTSGVTALSCHILVHKNCKEDELLQILNTMFKEKYQITHTTFQIEKSPHPDEDLIHN